MAAVAVVASRARVSCLARSPLAIGLPRRRHLPLTAKDRPASSPLPPPCSVWLVDKPTGWTSHDVCNAVRERLGIPSPLSRGRHGRAAARRRQEGGNDAAVTRVGHAGTLDPFCSGLLVLLIGRATKLAPFFTALSKEYEAVIRLGVVSDTLDADGVVVTPGGPTPVAGITPERVGSVLASFVGAQMQRVPAYSAVSVDGKRLHRLARAGQAPAEHELPLREVTVHSLERLDDGSDPETVRVRVSCSKGTYIRALARDIGDALGCGALCTELCRTRIGGLCVEDAVPPERVELAGGVPLARALAHLPPEVRDAARVKVLSCL